MLQTAGLLCAQDSEAHLRAYNELFCLAVAGRCDTVAHLYYSQHLCAINDKPIQHRLSDDILSVGESLLSSF